MAAISVVSLSAAAWVSRRGSAPLEPEPAKASPPLAVVTQGAQTGTIPLLADYRGELRANVAELAAESPGRLLEVRVNLGDEFEKGDVLAVVDSAETARLLAEARAQAKSAQATVERVVAELETQRLEERRGKQLAAEGLATAQELLALSSRVSILEAELSAARATESAMRERVSLYQQQISRTRLTAPFAGAVADRYLDPGATVGVGSPVLRLVQAGPLEVRFRASELHLSELKRGIPLSVTTQQGGRYPGKLERVSAEVNPTDRSLAAQGRLLAEHAALRPGMYVHVLVELGTLSDATLVPREALVSRPREAGETGRGLFSVEKGVARLRPVDVLGQHEALAAVTGVTAGELVVVEGQDRLVDGAAVVQSNTRPEQEVPERPPPGLPEKATPP